METILGIDLGTTNSVVAIIRDGKAEVLKDSAGQPLLPSVVGLDQEGRLLVGQAARNQAILAPHRTVASVKRRMGEDTRLSLGDRSFTPQEISCLILKTLKQRAETVLGYPVSKAVITVPAFFGENQRAATREAGELAGLEVVRIINEPTAASLTYTVNRPGREKLLVYDLGGGTFDVSIVQIEDGVVEVLASHGDTKLGGDDFDQLLLDHVCDEFHQEQGIDVRKDLAARSRLLQAVEQAKKNLSFEACTAIEEEFIAERKGTPLSLQTSITRPEYETLIAHLLDKTIQSVDHALADAKLHAKDIDKVILVGGSSRTPMVHSLLLEQLGKQPHLEVDPDLCVAMGAAIQGGLIAGLDVGPVLVDITPKTLGVCCVGELNGLPSDRCFSPVIRRNTALPASRSNMYYTMYKGQAAAEIDVYQGEHEDVQLNDLVGSFTLEDLDEAADANSEVLVRFDLGLDGTLTVTAVERATSHEKKLTIQNAITRFRAKDHDEAKKRLAEIFGGAQATSTLAAGEDQVDGDDLPEPIRQRLQQNRALLAKADRLMDKASEQDATEIKSLAHELQSALVDRSAERIDRLSKRLDDLLFYLEDA
jgi:molecular chaperone DnaK